MKKLHKFALAVSSLALFVSPAIADDFGIFGSGLVLDFNGTKTLYEITLAGDSRLTPSSPPTINSTSAAAFSAGTLNLGTFDTVAGDSLKFVGGDILTYKHGYNVDFTQVNLSIDGGSYTSISLNWDTDLGGGGDQRWYTQTGGTGLNLLSGLSEGVHTLHVYFDAHSDSTSSYAYDNNSNIPGNYQATFTVVPEPSSLVLVLGSMFFGGSYLARRKHS